MVDRIRGPVRRLGFGIGLASVAAIPLVALVMIANPPRGQAVLPPDLSQGLLDAQNTRARSLTVTVTSSAMKIDAEATFDRSDARAVHVIEGTLNTASWFNQTFGEIRVGGFPAPYLFLRSTPSPSVNPDSVSIKATSYPIEIGRATSFPIELAPDFPSQDTDSLTIHMVDYSVTSVSPEPYTFSGGTVRWRGRQPEAHLALGLSYTGQGQLLDTLQNRPETWIPYPWSQVFIFLIGFYWILPALAVVWVANRILTVAGDTSGRTRTVARLVIFWTGLAVASGFFDFRQTFTRVIEFNTGLQLTDPSALWALGSLAAIGGAIACALPLLLVTRMMKARTLGAILGIVGRGFLLGAAIGSAIETAAYLAGLALPDSQWQAASYLVVLPIMLGIAAYTAHLLRKIYASERRTPRLIILGLIMAAAGISIPWVAVGGPPETATHVQSLVLGNAHFVTSNAGALFGAVAFVALLGMLKPDLPVYRVELRPVIVIVFALFVVGVYPLVFDLPLGLIAALILGGWLLLLEPARAREVEAARETIIRDRRKWLAAALQAVQAGELERADAALEKKAIAAELTPDEYHQRREELDAYVEQRRNEAMVNSTTSACDVALAFGPRDTRWENAWIGLSLGVIFAAPLVLYDVIEVQAQFLGYQPYPILDVMVEAINIVVIWAGAGFFFGYFFETLRFSSGLYKALLVGLFVAVVQLPTSLTGFQNAIAAAVTVLHLVWPIFFFVVVGLVFDYRTWRVAFEPRKARRAMLDVTGLQPALATGGFVLSSVGLTLLTAVTGQFGQLLTPLLQVIPRSSSPTGLH